MPVVRVRHNTHARPRGYVVKFQFQLVLHMLYTTLAVLRAFSLRIINQSVNT